MSFSYELGTNVKLVMSDEIGKIVGRAEYTDDVNQYLVLYKASGGRQVKEWWGESELSPYNGRL